MKYRIDMDISFNDKADAEVLLNFIEGIKAKTYEPKGIEKISCFQVCRYHECTHDEAHPVQCKDYLHVDFKASKITHKL